MYASREVLVSAGTINSAKLLMLSGIGPADHLTSLGIKVGVFIDMGVLFEHPVPTDLTFSYYPG